MEGDPHRKERFEDGRTEGRKDEEIWGRDQLRRMEGRKRSEEIGKVGLVAQFHAKNMRQNQKTRKTAKHKTKTKTKAKDIND